MGTFKEQAKIMWKTTKRKWRSFRNKPPGTTHANPVPVAEVPVLAEIPEINTGKLLRFLEWLKSKNPYIKFGVGGTGVAATVALSELSTNGDEEFKRRTELALSHISTFEKFIESDPKITGLTKVDVIRAQRLLSEAQAAHGALNSQFVTYQTTMHAKRALNLPPGENKSLLELKTMERGFKGLNDLIKKKDHTEDFLTEFAKQCRVLTGVCQLISPEGRTTSMLQAAQLKDEQEQRMSLLNS